MTDSNRQAAATGWLVGSLWFGLAATSIHLLAVLYIRYVQHELTWTGREFFWMAPLSYILVYAMVGSIGGIVAFFRPAVGRPHLVMITFSGLLCFGALLLFLPRIHPLASAILAAGLAIQAGRMRRRDAPRVPALIRLAALPAIVIGVIGGAAQVTRQSREDRAIAALAPRADAPNVVLIVLDAVRAHNLSAYGYPEPTTPTLERLARQGVLFERAFATSPWSLPSHAGIFTGLLPSEMHADWKVPFSRKVPTLAERLRSRGRATGMFSANSAYVTWETGLARGFTHVDDYALTVSELVRANIFEQALSHRAARFRGAPWMFAEHYRRDASQIANRFLDWQARLGDRPFFAFLNLLDAHEEPLVSDTVIRRFEDGSHSPDEAAYNAAIAEMDRVVGRLVDSLAQRQVLDRTLLIVTADHGQLLGEHGLMYHGTSLYRRALRVPLVMRFPGELPKGGRVEPVVSLRDLAATVLDLISQPAEHRRRSSEVWTLEKRPLGRDDDMAVAQASHLANGNPGPARTGSLDALITNRWHYIEGPGRNRELFDYTTDTTEAVNLALDTVWADTVTMLSKKLRSIAPHSAPLVDRPGGDSH